MKKLAEALFSVLVSVWVGSLWTIGYLVVPVLFASLGDRVLAGQIAGRLFSMSGWLGLGAALYLLAFLLIRHGKAVVRQTAFHLVVVMAVLLLASQFAIQPLMAQMKLDALPEDVMASALRDRFVFWHGVSSVLYLVQSALGLWLLAGMVRR